MWKKNKVVANGTYENRKQAPSENISVSERNSFIKEY